jgi:2-polyprenyl-6-methoxyphenol hydroxylase-like FAD-dependent oxidoreductase
MCCIVMQCMAAGQGVNSALEDVWHQTHFCVYVQCLNGLTLVLVHALLHMPAGQGVNSALEDVCVLERQLDAAGDDLTQALSAYEQQRLPDSEALVKLVQVRIARN